VRSISLTKDKIRKPSDNESGWIDGRSSAPLVHEVDVLGLLFIHTLKKHTSRVRNGTRAELAVIWTSCVFQTLDLWLPPDRGAKFRGVEYHVSIVLNTNLSANVVVKRGFSRKRTTAVPLTEPQR
jgi:hypothetical protein